MTEANTCFVDVGGAQSLSGGGRTWKNSMTNQPQISCFSDSSHVGDSDHPRNRPRVGTLCVGVPKGGPPTTPTSPTIIEPNRPRATAHVGGQHQAAQGMSTSDAMRPPDAHSFAEFEAERKALAGTDQPAF